MDLDHFLVLHRLHLVFSYLHMSSSRHSQQDKGGATFAMQVSETSLYISKLLSKVLLLVIDGRRAVLRLS